MSNEIASMQGFSALMVWGHLLNTNKILTRACATEPFLSILDADFFGPIAQLVRASDS